MTNPLDAKKRCVLLVDDDPFIIAVYTAKLKKAGLEVDPVSDGAEALRYLETLRPDLVILDLNMPKLNGIEVLKFIRNNPSLQALPVLVLTNVCSDSIMQETWQSRPTRYLIKRETPPNVVVDEVVQLLSTPSPMSAPTPPPPPVAQDLPAETCAVDDRITVFLGELRSAKTAEDIREALVKVREALSAPSQVCRQQPADSMARHLDETMATLFEEIYAQPEVLNASLFRSLEMGIERLRGMFSERGPALGAAVKAAIALVASEDDGLRQSLARMLRRPFLRPICVGDIGTALHLLRENDFDVLVLDAYPEDDYIARVRTLPGADRRPVIVLTPLQHYRAAQKPGFERVAKPINAADIAVKLFLLSQSLPTS